MTGKGELWYKKEEATTRNFSAESIMIRNLWTTCHKATQYNEKKPVDEQSRLLETQN